MAFQDTGRPITDLLGSLVSDISGLFRKEIELAKAEASEKVEEAAKAGRNLAIGGVAWAMISRGLAELKANKLNMERTVHSVRMDANAVRESF